MVITQVTVDILFRRFGIEKRCDSIRLNDDDSVTAYDLNGIAIALVSLKAGKLSLSVIHSTHEPVTLSMLIAGVFGDYQNGKLSPEETVQAIADLPRIPE